ncbi:GbsR/MarR family transcriptional regulator [Yoonia maritima]|uniref:GbsR/MarR family transcriptional regulator n=1 Tax=Yoonia maritima TaxID=1435347 RepID=UPI000D10295C|nr:MarR family transcriptional regulator [Yoonia maritima]
MTQTPEDKFIETLGLISQADGSPRISGQITAYLVLAGEACSLTQIAEDLDVSKASVSTNVRLLEVRGIVVRESRKGSRQDLWRALPRPHQSILSTMSERFKRNAAQIDEIAASFPADKEHKREPVSELADFYRQSADFLKSWADALAQNDTISMSKDVSDE